MAREPSISNETISKCPVEFLVAISLKSMKLHDLFQPVEASYALMHPTLRPQRLANTRGVELTRAGAVRVSVKHICS